MYLDICQRKINNNIIYYTYDIKVLNENINLVPLFSNNKMKHRITIIALILMIGIASTSCRSSRQQRYAEKTQVEMEKESEKMVEEYREYHYNRQADETQEMMKKSKKRAKKVNRKKQGSFWDRLFNKKRPGCGGN